MAEADTIFKATYSNVPVYEMPCKGVAVMKRRSDSWMNATQILKVAGFDKPQRTRVLEREVQKGTHEKVQGGYGKYQGTWIPPDLGMDLAKQYGVDHLLLPIFNYVAPKNGSPPPAPKHITAAPKGPRQKKGSTPAVLAGGTPKGGSMPPPPAPSTSAAAGARTPPVRSGAGRGAGGAAAAARAEQQQAKQQAQQQRALQQAQSQQQQQQQQQQAYNAYPHQQQQPSYYVDSQLSQVESYDDSAASPGPSQGSDTSRTPSPIGSEPASAESYGGYSHAPSSSQRRKRKHHEQQQQSAVDDQSMMGMGGATGQQQSSSGGPAAYARAILDYYISESASIPSFLISPPADFDPNVVIDDDGHTALHWACAMGRLRIVKLLLTAGADIFRANAIGQTALMRSVMFTNNYDLRKFPEMFELLHRSTINIDRTDRTVFHYAVDLALTKGKPHAAKYYLEVLLDRLKEYPREVADILNFQDEEGETALTLAARARYKSLVKILLGHGADPKLTNRDGKSAEDYILEDERYRHQDSAMMGVDASVMQQAQVLPPAQNAQWAQGQGHAPQRMDSSMTSASSVFPIPTPAGQSAQLAASNGYYPLEESHLVEQPAILPATILAPTALPLHLSETARRVSTQGVPQVNQQLEVLATAMDNELEDKERDISQAHALLASIQAEAVEHAKLVNVLKAQAEQLEECQQKEEALRKELKDKMGKRFRLGWEKYVRDEEERQKAFVTISKDTTAGLKPIQQHKIILSATQLNGAGGKDAEKAQTAIPADLQHIFSALPSSPDALASSVKESVDKLDQLKSQRKELFDTLIRLQAEAGGDRITDYRKLIALGCGIAVDDVTPDFVKSVLEQLDNGDELALVGQLEGEETAGDEDNDNDMPMEAQ